MKSDKDRGDNREDDVMLNYKPRNHEINVLYLAFSNLTKTIKVARESLDEGDDNQALLNYHEVAHIFGQLGNEGKRASCMNNLGCLYLKKAAAREIAQSQPEYFRFEEFRNSIWSLSAAISIQ